MQIADIDLGALGRASLRVQGNINLSGKLVNQDQELVRSSFREQEKTNFKFDLYQMERRRFIKSNHETTKTVKS